MKPDLYIGGRWVARADRMPVENPATGAPIGAVSVAGTEDVEAAVEAARRPCQEWPVTDPAERAAVIAALADAMTAREREFAETITAEMGAPIDFSLEVQTRLALGVLRSSAGFVGAFGAAEPVPGEPSAVAVRKPAGVVAAITPWNYPL